MALFSLAFITISILIQILADLRGLSQDPKRAKDDKSLEGLYILNQTEPMKTYSESNESSVGSVPVKEKEEYIESDVSGQPDGTTKTMVDAEGENGPTGVTDDGGDQKVD